MISTARRGYSFTNFTFFGLITLTIVCNLYVTNSRNRIETSRNKTGNPTWPVKDRNHGTAQSLRQELA